MPKFIVTFSSPATAYAEATIEAETLVDAEDIAREMREADMPRDNEFGDVAIMDRRAISVASVKAAGRGDAIPGNEGPGLAEKLQIVTHDLSARGLQTLAMMLLSNMGKAAEAAPNPVSGESVIREIADIACQHYRKR